MSLLLRGVRSCLITAYGLPCRDVPLGRAFSRRITAASSQLLSHPSTLDAEQYPNISGLELAESYRIHQESLLPARTPLPSLVAWKERQELLNGYWHLPPVRSASKKD
jgi:hypothetical protein